MNKVLGLAHTTSSNSTLICNIKCDFFFIIKFLTKFFWVLEYFSTIYFNLKTSSKRRSKRKTMQATEPERKLVL